MHPTPRHEASYDSWMWARVMPGVRRRLANHEGQRLGDESYEGKWLRLARRAGSSPLVAVCVVGSGRGALRVASAVCRLPNKPLHPTADTQAVIFDCGAGRRVIGGVGRLGA